MAKARTPNLAAPLKAAKSISASFDAKVRAHDAIHADPLLTAHAVHLSTQLREFATLIDGRAAAAKGPTNG